MSLISAEMLCNAIETLKNISPEDFEYHVRHATGWHNLGIRLGCQVGNCGKVTTSSIYTHLRQKAMNLGLNFDHFRGQNQVPDDDDFIKIVKESHCLNQVNQKCVSAGGINRHYDSYKLRIKKLCIDTSHWKKRKSSIITMDDETLKTNVKNSTTWSDLCIKCKCAGGGTYKKSDIIKRIKMLGLDTNHFCSQGPKSKRDENIFVVNGKSSDARQIKKRLVRDHNRPYECSKCKNENFTMCDGVLMWKDQEIVLQLEHKNGINSDNRLDNLTFLCPNCHSQTSTYGGRNCKKIKLMQEWVEEGKKKYVFFACFFCRRGGWNDVVSGEFKEVCVSSQQVKPGCPWCTCCSAGLMQIRRVNSLSVAS
jgi:hypothetical protein